MKGTPLVSCVIPTFNRADKLSRAVQSVLTQTYNNIELLVVDDQSIDNTKTVVAELSKTDSRVKYLYNPEKGSNNARNFGIKNAAGEYIALLDDDDIWAKSKLEKQIAAFKKNPTAGLVFSAFARSKNNGKTNRRHPGKFSKINKEKIVKRLLKQNFITTSAILVKKQVFNETGYFDPEFKSFQDWELLTRIALRFPIVYLKEVLVFQYESPDSITKNKHGRILSNIKHLKKFYNTYRSKPKILSIRYCNLGTSLAKQKKHYFAEILFRKSLTENPSNFSALAGLSYVKIRQYL